MIIVEAASNNSGTLDGTITGQHTVKSSDCVLAVMVLETTGVAGSTLTLSFNGAPVPLIADSVATNDHAQFYYLKNPPVGTYTLSLTQTDGPGIYAFYAYTLSGVNKRQDRPAFKKATIAAAATFTVNIDLPMDRGLMIDGITSGANTSPLFPLSVEQTQAGATANATASVAVSMAYRGGSNLRASWSPTTGTMTGAYLAVYFEEDNAPNIWEPYVTVKDRLSLIRANALDTPTSRTAYKFDSSSLTYYQNSFLHTIGRVLSPPQTSTPAAETEFQSTQITIDKVYQGQSSAGAALTMDVSIPSPDAYLVVTGGSVIATGGAWVSAAFNGNAMVKAIGQSTTGADAEIWVYPFPTTGTWPLTVTPTAVTGQAYVNAMVLLGVDKRSLSVQSAAVSDAAATAKISTVLTPDAPNSLMINVLSTLNAIAAPIPDESQNQVFNATPINANEYVIVGYQQGSAPNVLEYNLTAAVNASLVGIALRPANAVSQWFPSIDTRTLNGPVDVNALDSGKSPVSGRYGYYSSNFYLNSFLHTIGRTVPQPGAALVNASIAQVAATLTFTGGTQVVAAKQLASIAQVAATLTFTGGTQTIATVNNASIAQVAATLTLSGGTQVIATINNVSIAQVGATLTFSGGTQTVASVQKVSIIQVAATITFTGGTQTIATINNASITQTNATLTFSGGTQVLTGVGSVNISQTAASLTFSGGTQSVATGTLVSITIAQVAASLRLSGGSQAITATTPPDFVPITITLATQPLDVSLSARTTSFILSVNDDSLEFTLTASLLSATISGRPTTVTLAGRSMDVTLKG